MSRSDSTLGHLQQGPTARRPTFLLIQVLRALAAMMVVMHHATITLSDRLGLPHHGVNWVAGSSGVDIFFVISGFVMTISSAPLRSTPHAARTFLARRLERVVPLYWLMTALKLALILLDPKVSFNGIGSMSHAVASFLFLPTVGPAGALEPVLIVGWTLNLELFFYALFALSLWIRRPPLAVVAPVLLVLVALAHTYPSLALRFYGDPIVIDFIFGILLALALPALQRVPAWIAALLAAAALVPLTYVYLSTGDPRRLPLWGVSALVLVASALALEDKLGPRMPRWSLEMGDASYSIYLAHGFILPVVAIALAHLGRSWRGATAVGLLACAAGTLVASEALYRLVELPITQWFKGRRKTAVPANA